ncbi:MAG: AMP-binding protein [Acidimicrobiales bacterium]
MIGRVVREAAERFGDRSCYVTQAGWALSYRELDHVADEVAAGLTARGVRPGDVIALVLPTIPEYVIAYAGAARLGAITAGVNARLAPPERAKVLAAADPALVLATAELAPPGREVVEVVAATATEHALQGLRVPKGTPPDRPHDPDRPVAIVFTSGTTGTPKGAVFGTRQLSFVTEVDTGWRWADRAAPPTTPSRPRRSPTSVR